MELTGLILCLLRAVYVCADNHIVSLKHVPIVTLLELTADLRININSPKYYIYIGAQTCFRVSSR